MKFITTPPSRTLILFLVFLAPGSSLPETAPSKPSLKSALGWMLNCSPKDAPKAALMVPTFSLLKLLVSDSKLKQNEPSRWSRNDCCHITLAESGGHSFVQALTLLGLASRRWANSPNYSMKRSWKHNAAKATHKNKYSPRKKGFLTPFLGAILGGLGVICSSTNSPKGFYLTYNGLTTLALALEATATLQTALSQLEEGKDFHCGRIAPSRFQSDGDYIVIQSPTRIILSILTQSIKFGNPSFTASIGKELFEKILTPQYFIQKSALKKLPTAVSTALSYLSFYASADTSCGLAPLHPGLWLLTPTFSQEQKDAICKAFFNNQAIQSFDDIESHYPDRIAAYHDDPSFGLSVSRKLSWQFAKGPIHVMGEDFDPEEFALFCQINNPRSLKSIPQNAKRFCFDKKLPPDEVNFFLTNVGPQSPNSFSMEYSLSNYMNCFNALDDRIREIYLSTKVESIQRNIRTRTQNEIERVNNFITQLDDEELLVYLSARNLFARPRSMKRSMEGYEMCFNAMSPSLKEAYLNSSDRIREKFRHLTQKEIVELNSVIDKYNPPQREIVHLTDPHYLHDLNLMHPSIRDLLFTTESETILNAIRKLYPVEIEFLNRVIQSQNHDSKSELEYYLNLEYVNLEHAPLSSCAPNQITMNLCREAYQTIFNAMSPSLLQTYCSLTAASPLKEKIRELSLGRLELLSKLENLDLSELECFFALSPDEQKNFLYSISLMSNSTKSFYYQAPTEIKSQVRKIPPFSIVLLNNLSRPSLDHPEFDFFIKLPDHAQDSPNPYTMGLSKDWYEQCFRAMDPNKSFRRKSCKSNNPQSYTQWSENSQQASIIR